MRFITSVLLLACIALAIGCSKTEDALKESDCEVSVDSASYTAATTDTILIKARRACLSNHTSATDIHFGTLPPGCFFTGKVVTTPVLETHLLLYTKDAKPGNYPMTIFSSEPGYTDAYLTIALVIK